MLSKKFKLSDFDFNLPEELIAQYPSSERENSKLFHLNREAKSFTHSHFYNIHEFLHKGDVLVLNNAKVIPARLYFKKDTGAIIEVVLAQNINDFEWLVLTNRTKRLKVGSVANSIVNDNVSFEVLSREDNYLRIKTNQKFTDKLLEEIGNIPLPPYIKREADEIDKNRYQTVYAEEPGAVAAPTAGLHFTEDILESLTKKGVKIVTVTLNVAWGTFSPVRGEALEEHDMHEESFFLSEQAANEINTARKEGRKIIAVGTTSLRVLESTYKDGVNIAGKSETNIFIYPPYKIKSINAMITNFHTPKSTLLMLVSAFAGYDLIMKAYKEAIEKKYRFFSYGDAMFID